MTINKNPFLVSVSSWLRPHVYESVSATNDRYRPVKLFVDKIGIIYTILNRQVSMCRYIIHCLDCFRILQYFLKTRLMCTHTLVVFAEWSGMTAVACRASDTHLFRAHGRTSNIVEVPCHSIYLFYRTFDYMTRYFHQVTLTNYLMKCHKNLY